jgi:hypothetical protein
MIWPVRDPVLPPPASMPVDWPAAVEVDPSCECAVMDPEVGGWPVNNAGGYARSIVSRVAAENLSASRLVYVGVDGVRYASSDDVSKVHALGLTRSAVITGQSVFIQTEGDFTDDSWAWIPGPVFLGLNGFLTQTADPSKHLVQIGVAMDATTVVVDIEPPILRA